MFAIEKLFYILTGQVVDGDGVAVKAGNTGGVALDEVGTARLAIGVEIIRGRSGGSAALLVRGGRNLAVVRDAGGTPAAPLATARFLPPPTSRAALPPDLPRIPAPLVTARFLLPPTSRAARPPDLPRMIISTHKASLAVHRHPLQPQGFFFLRQAGRRFL